MFCQCDDDINFIVGVFAHISLCHCFKVLNEPAVTLPSDDKQLYWTLVMSNPDGHLTDSNYEVLHWMM